MLLAVSLIASAVVGVIGYLNGRESLRAAAFDQLTTVRELRAEEIQREISSVQLGVKLDSRNESAVQATQAFVDGFEALQESELTSAQQEQIDAFYKEGFIPALEARSGQEYSAESFVPATRAGRYLQANYTAGRAFDDYDAALALDDAGDGSAWSAANARYGSYFAGLVDDLGYEDVLILNKEADVVYSAYKSVDLGVNMKEEPYTTSALTRAYEEVLRTGSLDAVVTTDFERYLPSLNVPTAWILSPVGTATNIIGVMAVQIPIDQINAVMTGNETWADQGLGDTGEVYIAGPDLQMRSVSRLLVEHPDEYAETAIANGTAPATAERIVAVGGTVQLQTVDFTAAENALRGQTGTAITADYTNPETLVAYSPLTLDGLNWVIVAKIDADEAFAPVAEFTRNLLLSTLAILILVSILALLLAQVFTRPVKRLVEAVRRVAGGDLAVQVPQRSRDEFGDLGNAFNEMASSLRVKQELIDEQRAENEQLLLTLMPEAMAERYKKGEEAISEEHDNVSVVYAELVGFDDYARSLSGSDEIAKLNELMRGFDEAATKAGVEKVRSLRNGYLASSGLIVPRVDNVRRAVEFAHQMRAAVSRFNSQHGANLDIRAGVDTGTVTSGLVARTSLAYDLWGDAVSLAYRVGAVTAEPGVFVSDAVRERLADSVPLEQAGMIELRGTSQPVWRVEAK
ncbi:adenylate/guanylate cyclase domain-containing protein [Microbacterium sp. NPDC091382]|uniref:adenylate/guanylate cyclase domain-containing protein n=1 Tax=Microbacterium sp. NPDC091382 TaxID=3364210 RepID=UPI00381ACDAB